MYWHLITIVSDLLIFPGTAIKLLLDYHYPCLGVSLPLLGCTFAPPWVYVCPFLGIVLNKCKCIIYIEV